MGACKDIVAPNQSTSSSMNGNVYLETIEFRTHSNSAAVGAACSYRRATSPQWSSAIQLLRTLLV
jgi:hypothetical protein